jgi:hypothetical protein
MPWPALSAAAVSSACPSAACGTFPGYVVSDVKKHVQPARPGEVKPLVLGPRLQLHVSHQQQQQQQHKSIGKLHLLFDFTA